MSRGLNIGTNFFNRQAAIDDFNAIGKFAVSVGLREVVEKHLPPKKVGWRTIDKAIAAIRQELDEAGYTAPPSPSSL